MGTAQLVFAGEQWGATGSHVNGSRMTGSGPVRKYVLRMPNRKLGNIRPSEPFDRKLATGSVFPRFF